MEFSGDFRFVSAESASDGDESFDLKMDVSSMDDISSMESRKVKVLRRRLTLSSNSSTQTPERKSMMNSSMESCLENDSPLPECPDFDSPMEYTRSKKCAVALDSDMRRRLALQSSSSPMTKISLSPMLLFGDSPVFKPILNGSMGEKHSELSMCEMADEFPDLNENFRIKRRNVARRPRSAPTINMSLDESFGQFENPCIDSGEHGGFCDGLCQEEVKNNLVANAPSSFRELIVAPLEMDKENRPHVNLQNSLTDNVFEPSSPLLQLKSRSISCSGKRCGTLVDASPVLPKKPRTKFGRSSSVYDGDPALRTRQTLESPRTLLMRRSHSFDSHNVKSPGIDITSLLDIDDKNLIGDRSKEYCLPTTLCKHPDLKAITPETLAAAMDNKFQEVIGKLIIIDCRYPYEYEGGHIRGAINLHERQGIIDTFLSNPLYCEDKRLILVFHCEFSSKRGPNLCRFLRNKDRDIHANFYPKLYYPEMYLLEGGYREFFEKKKNYCEPQEYRGMFDVQFQKELKLFSRRSRSWGEENSSRYRNRSKLLY